MAHVRELPTQLDRTKVGPTIDIPEWVDVREAEREGRLVAYIASSVLKQFRETSGDTETVGRKAIKTLEAEGLLESHEVRKFYALIELTKSKELTGTESIIQALALCQQIIDSGKDSSAGVIATGIMTPLIAMYYTDGFPFPIPLDPPWHLPWENPIQGTDPGAGTVPGKGTTGGSGTEPGGNIAFNGKSIKGAIKGAISGAAAGAATAKAAGGNTAAVVAGATAGAVVGFIDGLSAK